MYNKNSRREGFVRKIMLMATGQFPAKSAPEATKPHEFSPNDLYTNHFVIAYDTGNGKVLDFIGPQTEAESEIQRNELAKLYNPSDAVVGVYSELEAREIFPSEFI